jgi:hypothetical protein
MSIEKTASEMQSVPQKEVHFAAAGQIPVRCERVRLEATPVTGPYTVLLPKVTEAQGRRYFVVCRNADAFNTITIADDDDSECWEGDVVFNGKCDRAIFESDGQCWFRCCDTLTFTGTTEPPTSAPTTSAPEEQ